MKFHHTLEHLMILIQLVLVHTSHYYSQNYSCALFVSIFSNFVVPPGRIRRVRREESFSDDADASHRKDDRLQRSDLPVPSRTGESGRGQIGHSKGHSRSTAAGSTLDRDSPFLLLLFQLFHQFLFLWIFLLLSLFFFNSIIRFLF